MTPSLLIDIIWLLFLFSLLGYFIFIRYKAAQAKTWKTADAKVIACEWSIEGHRIWPKIQYLYEVEGREYIGEHLFIDTSHNTPNSAYARGIAYKVAQAFKDDKPIKVYYDPDLPQTAAVDVTIPGKIHFIIFLLAGLIILHLTIIAVRFLYPY